MTSAGVGGANGKIGAGAAAHREGRPTGWHQPNPFDVMGFTPMTGRLSLSLMVDNLTPEKRSRLMSLVRGKDTKPEMIVRRLAHRLGYRFRLHRRDLPGSPDLIFPSRRKAIFVHGCYWHRHDCKKATTPKSNTEFWQKKFADNVARDRRDINRLAEEGWDTLVIWQCETNNPEVTARKIQDFLN